MTYDNIKEYDRWQQYEHYIKQQKIPINNSNYFNMVYTKELNKIEKTIESFCKLDKKLIIESTKKMKELSNIYITDIEF
jgi:hypothetical protein